MVINRNVGQQVRDNGKHDYYGKGKGKMFEEPEFKWVKVGERERIKDPT